MNEVVHWYALSTVLLFVKMFAISLFQGYHRIGKRTFKTPEDAALVGRQAAAEELPQVQRAANAWRNDLENIPIFLALGVAYVWVEASPGLAPWLFLLFTAARYLHTVFFLSALQPWRTVAYGAGIVCLFAMCTMIIAALF
ncbi:MAPEG family protein [Halomonas sp. LR3S48]|uniref:MAPEG family protein n=1 Tax=Halomonadaceae TaxID=28256 RepID=UPI0021E48E7B|nr:MAPEG family protein [Halomonas sp. LR3S48]UYG04572.1 MAPEG family protein [Halomonas sp. LR3S48]